MKRLCQVGLDIVRERSDEQDQQRKLAHIARQRQELDNVMHTAADHLRDIQACKSMKDQLEHWNLLLHRSYVTSELYRPFLRKDRDVDSDLTDNCRTCVKSLVDTVNAFLGLENITRCAHQSWAAVHRALSSGLLLAVTKEHLRNWRVRMLLERLIAVLSGLGCGLGTSELAAPITRSVSALTSLISFDHGRRTSAREILQEGWGSGDSQLSTVCDEALSTTTSISPYSQIVRILWGS